MRKSSIIIILALALTTFLGCKPSIPDGIISPGDMEDILYDYHVSRAMSRETSNSEMDMDYKEVMYHEAMLKKYGVTAAEFDSSLVYYFSHADRFAKIYERVCKRLNEDATEIGASVGAMADISTFTLSGDTANIWNDATELLLMPVPGYNRVSFEIKADTAYRKGDSFMLNMLSSYLYRSGAKDALIYMAITYDNDSISTHSIHNTVSGVATLRIPADQHHVVKQIRTFIYLAPSGENNSNNMLFLSKIQLLRFHKVENKKGGSTEAVDEEKEVKMPRVANPAGADSLLKAPAPMRKLNTSGTRQEDLKAR